MFIMKKTVVNKKTKTGTTRTETTTFGFSRKSRRKKKPAVNHNTGWFKREMTEVGNTIIEATFNNLWHTPLWVAITTWMLFYLQYLLVLVPGLPVVFAAGAVLVVSFFAAALLLAYLRRFVVWGAGKVKGFFRRK